MAQIILPPVGGIESQTFHVREAQTTCLRFDLTPTSHAVPGPKFLSVQKPSIPVNHQASLPQTRSIISTQPGDARSFLARLPKLPQITRMTRINKNLEAKQAGGVRSACRKRNLFIIREIREICGSYFHFRV